jgi:mannose-1-phosphate guanylyltransferase
MRMRESGIAVPKPLATVLGVPLLERNLFALLGAGLPSIAIAVSQAADPTVVEFAETRCRGLCAALDAELEILFEPEPLGNIGALSMVSPPGDVVVVFADNLTALDLAALVAEHRAGRADLTLATHLESRRLPWGAVTLRDDGRIVAYEEKPAQTTRIASGVYVVGERARRLVPGDRPCGASDLVATLLASGAMVRGHEHRSLWIDVNDADALERARALVASDREAFDCWCPEPRGAVACAWMAGADGVLLGAPGDRPGLPSAWLQDGEEPLVALQRDLDPDLYARWSRPRLVGRFDHLDPGTERVARHYLVAGDVVEPTLPPSAKWGWLPRERIPSMADGILERSHALMEASEA